MVEMNSTLDKMEKNTMDNTSIPANKNRRSLLLLITVFILPILLAKLALNNQWLALGVTNQGKLLEQALTLADLGINEGKFNQQWLIIYRLPDTCPAKCLQLIEAVHNTYVALGKDMPRVTPLLLKKNIFSVEQSKQLARSQWQILPLTTQMKQLLNKPQVLITDPLGNIILSYQLPESNQGRASFGKAILADMKKLLKYSKVG